MTLSNCTVFLAPPLVCTKVTQPLFLLLEFDYPLSPDHVIYVRPQLDIKSLKKANQAESFCQALRTQAMYEYSGDQLQDSNIPMAEGEIFEVVEEDTDG